MSPGETSRPPPAKRRRTSSKAAAVLPASPPAEEIVGEVISSGLLSQKRVLPTRNRRGGPGVGHSDVDQTIMDALRRAEENRPLISENTVFLLVTDAQNLSSQPDAESAGDDPHDNSEDVPLSYQTYFGNPQVLKSCRLQQSIQTPDFTSMDDAATVSGRLRTRLADDAFEDTSDAAYIARHRKYEAFEKRQRRREKEKLTHEQYKLRERIDQLRAMEPLAFGGKDVAECEQKRQMMLTTAEDLAERYRVLLPPDRPRPVDKRVARSGTASDAEEDRAASLPAPQPNGSLKIKFKVPRKNAPASTSMVETLPGRKKGRSLSAMPEPEPESESPGPSKRNNGHAQSASPSPSSSRESSGSPPPEVDSSEITPRAVHSNAPTTKRRKRRTGSASLPPLKTRQTSTIAQHAPAPPEVVTSHGTCFLVAAAQRTEHNSRTTHRALMPFGVKAPDELQEKRDFELPEWIDLEALIAEREPEAEDGDPPSLDAHP